MVQYTFLLYGVGYYVPYAAVQYSVIHQSPTYYSTLQSTTL